MKDWFARKWAQFKKWVYGVLIAIGVVTLPLLAATVTFDVTMPTTNTDGSILSLDQIVETRLYCDIDPATFTPQTVNAPASHTADAVFTGPVTSADIQLSFGQHECFATVLAEYTDEVGNTARNESPPSEIAARTVSPPTPTPPGLN